MEVQAEEAHEGGRGVGDQVAEPLVTGAEGGDHVGVVAVVLQAEDGGLL